MSIYKSTLVGRSSVAAVARALAAGRVVWCAETGEGWQREGGCTLNAARHLARLLVADCDNRGTFYIVLGQRGT